MSDTQMARAYLNKANNAKQRGVHFDLSLVSFRNIWRAKKCYYTGLPLTKETRTVDRIDSSKGYVRGNVVACHEMFNRFKGTIENPMNDLNLDICTKGLLKWREIK